MSPVEYDVADADRRPLPHSYRTVPRRLGFRDDEQGRPFARFLRTGMAPAPEHVGRALRAGRRPAGHAYEVDDVAYRLTTPGPDLVETGWARTGRGTLVVACRTDMPA